MNNRLQVCCHLCFLYICLFLVLTPLSAAPTGEIIFVHPITMSEIWVSNPEGTTARKLFRQRFGNIDKIEVQEAGEYVLVVADRAIVLPTVLSMDWTDKAYPVEPADSLVTTWSKLKIQKAN